MIYASVPRFLDAGDGGLVVEFGSTVDQETNRSVMALAETLTAAKLAGVLELIPTYRSLLIQFDPLVVGRAKLTSEVMAKWNGSAVSNSQTSLWHVPVCYGGEFGMDLPLVARTHELDEAEVIRRHTAGLYRIFMIGFAPGFVYLGGLDPTLQTSRRTEPRLKTPPQSVSIGGMQTAVSPPLEIPSGWNFIGRTAVRTYDPARERGIFLFEPGDYLRLHAVEPATYQRQVQAAEAGDLIVEREHFHA